MHVKRRQVTHVNVISFKECIRFDGPTMLDDLMNKMIITLLGILLPYTMKFLKIIIGPHHFVYIDMQF